MTDPSLHTLCARAGGDEPAPPPNAPLSPPIYQASVFTVDGLEALDAIYEGRRPGQIYSRDSNPNLAALEAAVARLEGAEAALACASGMGALAAAFVTALSPGDHVLASRDLYGRTVSLLRGDLSRWGVEADFVDAADPAAVERALRPETRLVVVETLSNPLLNVADIPALAGAARSFQGRTRLLVDSTFATPVLCRPLSLGADVVMHSASKFLGGHSDLIAGVLCGDAAFIESARRTAVTWGFALGPFEAWLALRGIRTLALRMERAGANALAVARWLTSRPQVRRVFYPGLPSHLQRETAARVLRGGSGAMVSFELRGGARAASRFLRGLHRIPFAPSLGDVATSVSHPARTSHRSLTPAERRAAGVSEGLIRLSVGIGDPDDIIADLARALERI